MDLKKYEEALNNISETIVPTYFNNDKYEYVKAKLSLMERFENKSIYEELFTSRPFFFPYFRKNFLFICQNYPDFVGSVLFVNAYKQNESFKDSLTDMKAVYFKTNSKVIIAAAENLYRDTRKKLNSILDSPTILKDEINEVIKIIEPISSVRYYWKFRSTYYMLFRELGFSLRLLYNIENFNKINDLDKDLINYYVYLLSELSEIKYKENSKYTFLNFIIEDLELIYNKIEESHQEPKTQDRVSDSGAIATKPTDIDKAFDLLGHIEGLSWDEITITLISFESIRITARDFKQTYHFSELDMKDRRSSEKSDGNWKLLSLFALKNGTVTFKEIDDTRNYSSPKKAISTLQNKLKQVIGLQNNPIEKHKHRVGYVAKFYIKNEIPTQFHGSDQQIEKIYELKGE